MNGRFESQEHLYRAITGVVISLGVGLVTGSLLRMPPIQNANDESRWCTVWSLVERGTYIIDEAPWTEHTVDKIRREGHYYSSKPPLFPTIVAGGYAVLKNAFGLRLDTHPRTVVYTLLLVVNVLPYTVFLALYARFLRARGCGLPAFTYCLIAAAAGTYLTAYCLTFTNHTVGPFVCFFLVYLVWRISEQHSVARVNPSMGAASDAEPITNAASSEHSKGPCVPDKQVAPCAGERDRETQGVSSARFTFAGLLAGLLPSLDLLAAPLCLLAFIWLLRLDSRRTWRWFVPAAAIPIAASVLTNWLVMEDLRPAYAFKHTELYNYEGSFWSNPRGIAANTDSNAFYFFNIMLGHHGWFSHTPVFLIALAPLLVHPRGGPRGLPWFNTVVLLNFAFGTAFFVFNRSRDYGGTCQGFRWMFWTIPLWLMTLAPAVEWLWNRGREGTSLGAAAGSIGRAAACLALAGSVFSVAYALNAPWGTSWLHALFRAAGWVTY